MNTLLFISDNNAFKEDVCTQIQLYEKNFAIIFNEQDSTTVDLILLDENISKAEELKAKYPFTPIILLSKTEETNSYIFKNIQKPFKLSKLLLSISSSINLLENTEEGYIKFNNFELHPIKKEILCLRTKKIVKLTEKEVSILKYLYKSGNHPVNKSELLQQVWNYNAEVSTHTLETHIYRLRQKIMKGDKKYPLIITDNGCYLLKN